MSLVEETLRTNGWNAISEISHTDFVYSRFYYSTAHKTYAHVSCNGYEGNAVIESVDESDVLGRLSFEELKTLGTMIDKKSVAFIRLYSEKELASAKTEEEMRVLNERNRKTIQEAEEALRKR